MAESCADMKTRNLGDRQAEKDTPKRPLHEEEARKLSEKKVRKGEDTGRNAWDETDFRGGQWGNCARKISTGWGEKEGGFSNAVLAHRSLGIEPANKFRGRGEKLVRGRNANELRG